MYYNNLCNCRHQRAPDYHLGHPNEAPEVLSSIFDHPGDCFSNRARLPLLLSCTPIWATTSTAMITKRLNLVHSSVIEKSQHPVPTSSILLSIYHNQEVKNNIPTSLFLWRRVSFRISRSGDAMDTELHQYGLQKRARSIIGNDLPSWDSPAIILVRNRFKCVQPRGTTQTWDCVSNLSPILI